MTMTTVTLANLPHILKQLRAQVEAQDAQRAFYERELDGYLKKHKALEGSPVSVQSRVIEALKAFEHEQKRFLTNMRKQTGRSINLYWHQQLLSLELEMARRTEDHHLQTERARIFDLAFEKIHALLPRSVPVATPNLQESSGRLAVTLSRAQSETLQTAKRLLDLETQEEELAKQWTKSEVSIENAHAATSLSDFETYVMDWTLNDGHIPEPHRTGGLKGIGMGVLSELDESGMRLYEQTHALEQDVLQLRETIALAVDLAEQKHQPPPAELLQTIRQLFQKYNEVVTTQRDFYDDPMPF